MCSRTHESLASLIARPYTRIVSDMRSRTHELTALLISCPYYALVVIDMYVLTYTRVVGLAHRKAIYDSSV